jgi:hypothetical protein
MIVKRPVTVPTVALGATGLALILAGFFLAVPEGQRSDVAWLDLAVCGAVFLANFATLPLARPGSGDFSLEIPKLGILWTTHLLYTSLALGGVWRGWVAGVPFHLQLLYHLVLLFGLLTILSLAGQASAHAGVVAVAEGRMRGSLEAARKASSDCQAGLARSGFWKDGYTRFQDLHNDLRYLSPCNTETAVSLDLEIASLLSGLGASLASGHAAAENGHLWDTLTRCETLIHLRKQERAS